jgi:hypothetical protein
MQRDIELDVICAYLSAPPACVSWFILHIAFASIVSGVSFALMCRIAPSHFFYLFLSVQVGHVGEQPCHHPGATQDFPQHVSLAW